MQGKFRVGLTSDVGDKQTFKPDYYGIEGLDDHDGIEWEFMEGDSDPLTPDDVRDYDALLVFGRRVSADTFAGVDRPVLAARFGVGYDTVDVGACTDSGVALTITPDGVRRPMASSFAAFILALGHKLMWKDRITRDGRWDERYTQTGVGLRDRVLGLVGLGNIGRDLVELMRPFEMRTIACDPYVDAEEAAGLGVEMVDLDTLMRTSDFVCVCCMLNEETRHLIDADRIALMKSTAFLVNAARGPIVDQAALTEALTERRIQGAAIDVFDPEPPDPDDPILRLDNVLVTPHAMGMVDQCWQGIGRSAAAGILEVSAGRVPANVVNRDVVDTALFRDKLRRYAPR